MIESLVNGFLSTVGWLKKLSSSSLLLPGSLAVSATEATGGALRKLVKISLFPEEGASEIL